MIRYTYKSDGPRAFSVKGDDFDIIALNVKFPIDQQAKSLVHEYLHIMHPRLNEHTILFCTAIYIHDILNFNKSRKYYGL